MREQLRIDEMFAFVVVDTDGTEGIPAYNGPGGMATPMVGADKERVRSLMPVAQQVADQIGRDVELVRFTTREHVDRLHPNAPSPAELRRHLAAMGIDPSSPTYDPSDAFSEPEGPPRESESIPYKTFAEPLLETESNAILSTGIVVMGTVHDGRPGIAISYLVDGELLPPILVLGQQAEDLARLAAEALTAARRVEN